jgi:hypothetical protein
MTAQARAQVRLIVTANKPNITPANAGEQPRGSAPDEAQQLPAWREVFLYFLLLGFINVGGPVAQLTMMFNHMVERTSEVNPVIKALRDNGIEVTALHSHMLTENPRLFFMHFWANDDAQKLAHGLRAALDQMNIKKS